MGGKVRRWSGLGRVVRGVGGKLVGLGPHVARHRGAAHHPVTPVTGGVENVRALLEQLRHLLVRAALQLRRIEAVELDHTLGRNVRRDLCAHLILPWRTARACKG